MQGNDKYREGRVGICTSVIYDAFSGALGAVRQGAAVARRRDPADPVRALWPPGCRAWRLLKL